MQYFPLYVLEHTQCILRNFEYHIDKKQGSSTLTHAKGGFFSESVIRFLDLQIWKKIFQKTILSF